MRERAVSITLEEKGISLPGHVRVGVQRRVESTQGATLQSSFPGRFLRVPPFPGAKLHSFGEVDSLGTERGNLVPLVRQLKVGGTYWGAKPELPMNCVVLRIPPGHQPAMRPHILGPTVVWAATLADRFPWASSLIVGDCDPWHVLEHARLLVTTNFDEVSLIASIMGVPVEILDPETGDSDFLNLDAETVLNGVVCGRAYADPFTGKPMSAREAIELCGFWRRLIDSNRGIDGGIGFARWKRSHVAPLLWSGSRPFKFYRGATDASDARAVAIWRAKVQSKTVAALERRQVQLAEVEDGFLRSKGLGADCVPPLSITVDRTGAHFDPAQPSELEQLLQQGEFSDELIARARRLREVIVAGGIGKYERGRGEALRRPAVGRRHILVPGQVEDDRSVLSGGCGLVSNLELLKRVRASAPDAYILYKPHPDVIAGHRRGEIADRISRRLADEIVTDASISKLIDMIDEVHVNTSLAGFEALMRGRPVTTYGVPFYAGWGLTNDLGQVPQRRTAKRTLDELVAATLILYPRYLDPVTGLPCPAETVVDRLSSDAVESAGLLVTLRRLQGRLMRGFRNLAA